ncbi:MAG: conjugal transfer protein TraC [Candidatus Moranbacteria bacterium CG_4_9_14_3_um_filter_40_7]|nr:MAG: conjugal transfer protein TraC [Candidatus Moranbacteria bacterium CG23_combo_of_CG06-09_8_20_14_all_40_16]PIU81000.1 MAG: conjugal transfer protein TraC [Candidatus Moranbacteria bacterium CG06_land_8_20_14_3_00_40_12]PJA87893.1 MAG: conjugal transfer protein TraC [Candidatus Moranbacteria bacterium CG_4_9_14_3_um_filter_40_7]
MLDFLKKNKEPKSEPLPTDEVLLSERYYQEGLSKLQDLIAPSAIKITSRYIRVGETLAQTIFVITYPRYLHSNWFSPIINIDMPMDISMFIHPIDTNTILKNLRKTATQVQSQIHIEEARGMVRDPVLETAMRDIDELRDKLQQGTEKFFRFGLYITIYAQEEKELDKQVKAIMAILEAQLVYTKPAIFKTEQGFNSSLPLANDELNVGTSMDSSPLSTTFPFVSSNLSSEEGILYGINRHNNSLIIFDRFNMENGNMVVFAKSGAGKSYLVKLEVLRSLMVGTEVIIIDPENEYKHLCDTVGGTFFKISLNSKNHLNPFDLPKVGEDEDPVDVMRNNIAGLIGLLHLMLGNITPEEDSILDRSIRETYDIKDITAQADLNALKKEDFPTMSDLYQVLRNMEGGEDLAIRLEKYTEGIFSGFLNNVTNLDINNPMVVFNIRDMEEEMRPVAMYVVLQFIWNEMRTNIRKRIVLVDEAWVMMKYDDAASFLFGIAKRCRKYYTGLTTITQDVNDFLSSRFGKPIVTNSSIQILLKQSPAAIDVITETFYLTDQEKFLLLESNVGEGIFFAGTKHVAIKVVASYSEDQIITTDPSQIAEIEQAKKELAEEEEA